MRCGCSLVCGVRSLNRAVARASRTPPKLAVIIVVDQMRADYVDRFHADWTGGLNRLVSEGAWFQRAAYPYLTTVTCAGPRHDLDRRVSAHARRVSERLVGS